MVLKFIMLSDEDESFVREFEFLDSQTLLDFHNCIQSELEFDKSQLASFFISTDNWEKEEEFTLFDMGANSATMEDTTIDDVIIKKNQKLLYVFDYFNDRALYIEYTGEAEEIDGVEYPRCTSAKGNAPRQVTFGGRRSKKNYNNIMVSEDDDVDMDDVDSVEVPDVDGLFIEDEDDESLEDFDDEEMGEDDDITIDDLMEDEDDE